MPAKTAADVAVAKAQNAVADAQASGDADALATVVNQEELQELASLAAEAKKQGLR